MYTYNATCAQYPPTLCDWVKNIRVKKIQMKRKFRAGGNLRVCAILSTALLSAENELRLKQQERFNRWLEFQTKNQMKTVNKVDDDYVKTMAKNSKEREDIENMWKCELSGLDEFMKKMSSNNN
ncbi:uncharacterized protein LOC119664505 [Teleopsis dalmanni]|uniref:uncharacterized protein LOC119664505 n=1 Tax=Teleopsis dalmanni TaxID=139649 RepID=UPI0018CD30E5|nr:uncharacterized protein LOC119664505 [Teleopsis dalmanni]